MSPRIGRPIKADARREKLNIRLTVEEKRDIEKCAELLNLSRTDAIMKAIRMVLESKK